MLFSRGNRIPDYIFKSAQTNDEDAIKQVLDLIKNSLTIDNIDHSGTDATGYVDDFIAKSSIILGTTLKSALMNELSEFGDIENDADLSVSLREYLMYEVGNKTFFYQLADNEVRGEITEVNDELVTVNGDELLITFSFSSFLSSQEAAYDKADKSYDRMMEDGQI